MNARSWRANVFDIPLLATRLGAATLWLSAQPETGRLPVGYFGASTGAAAALWAAADAPAELVDLVSCEHELAVIPGATHLFEEAGALERVGELATGWLVTHLTPSAPAA